METLAILFLSVVGAYADRSNDSTSHSGYNRNRYLSYQPSFAHSLPIQILITGIVFTLALVLFLYLLFTAQYHWPLARLNYFLQFSGACTLLIWLSATLGVVLHRVHQRSKNWPYMLDYVAVDVPNSRWTDAQDAWWLVMESATSGLAHITHIQLLTLFYPSPFETRLIFLLLGPLAIASSAMVFAAMNSDPEVQDLGDAVRNVCNSALSLLLTAALLTWGFVIHRKAAWRTDGGTAVFGTGAISLAILSTVSNFIQIFLSRRIHWLLSMTWAVVLWQSFLGWWWWVGSGEGINEVQDMLERERRRRRRKRAKKRSKGVASGADAHRSLFRAFRRRAIRLPPARGGTPDHEIVSSRPDGSSHPDNNPSNIDTQTHTTSSHSSAEPSNIIARSWKRLCHDHRRAAIEQAELRNTTPGWGLGSFGVKEAERKRVKEGKRREDIGITDRGKDEHITPNEMRDGRDGDTDDVRSGGESDVDGSSGWGRPALGRTQSDVDQQTGTSRS